jgi:pyridoxine 4-dehydrogenase
VATPTKLKLGDAEVPRIGMGTNRLTHTRENITFIREAVAAGLGLIDTAHLYTGGQSEATIGDAQVQDRCVVATKGGFRPGQGNPDALRAQIEESLQRLQTERIALYYLHRPDPETPLEDSVGAIKDYVDDGKIRHVGVSEVSIEQIERARNVLPITAVQNNYSRSERKWDDVVDYCAGEGIVFVPFFPLRGSDGSAVAEIARQRGATPTQVTLAWLLKRSPAMLPIPGTLSLEHAKENLVALELDLSDEEFEDLG